MPTVPRLAIAVFLCVSSLSVGSAPAFGTVGPSLDRVAIRMGPVVEWELDNPVVFGNPFDLEARATFVHASGDTRVSDLFYDGGQVWRLRFAPDREGVWTFTTESFDPDLDGLTGTVTVAPNPDPEATGFLFGDGLKFVLPTNRSTGSRRVRFDVFQNDVLFDTHIAGEDWGDPAVLQSYIDDASAHGFRTLLFSVYNSWFEFGAQAYTEHSSLDPDLVTFAVLEAVIQTAHAQGVHVHLLAWGDEARRWTPTGVGGINGVPDRRLQRAIAARLGPLPGWSMTYGVDLETWVTNAQVGEWAATLTDRSGWRHLWSAKGRLHPSLSTTSLSGIGADSAEEILALSAILPDRPIVYEERFTHERYQRFDMDRTRRQLWWHAFAEGVGAIWGYFDISPHPYPNLEQLVTLDRFLDGRYRLDLEVAPAISDALALANPVGDAVLVYAEDTDQVVLNLSGSGSGAQPAIAVDTRQAYTELSLGMLAASDQVWNAPYESDWAIAIGVVGEPDLTPSSPPSDLMVEDSTADSALLVWSPAVDLDSGISSYLVERDGVTVATVPGAAIAGSVSYLDSGLSDATSYLYRVVAVNGGGLLSDPSMDVLAMTLVDTTPPQLVSAITFGDPERVRVEFSEPVDRVTALDPSHYTITSGTSGGGVPSVSVLAVSPVTGSGATSMRTVELEVTPLESAVVYILAVDGVTDLATTPNPVLPGTSIEFEFFARVTQDLVVLYGFRAGSGAVVHDVSGVSPALDLEIADPDRVAWSGVGESGAGRLDVEQSTVIASPGPATKIYEACTASDAITIEAWIEPLSLDQSGPSRIVSFSVDTGARNFTLGQDSANYDTRLRTTETSENGTPSVASPGLMLELTHVVYSRDANGTVEFYRDGTLLNSDVRGGDFSNWDSSHRFALANELTEDRAWLGGLSLVAIYSRALTPDEVAINFVAGPDAVSDPGAETQRPGDFTRDGAVDVTDVIALLAYLFGTAAVTLPCDTESANRTLLDVSGDAAVDIVDVIFLLEYLFQLGTPPVLGESCVPIPDCAASACP